MECYQEQGSGTPLQGDMSNPVKSGSRLIWWEGSRSGCSNMKLPTTVSFSTRQRTSDWIKKALQLPSRSERSFLERKSSISQMPKCARSLSYDLLDSS